MFAAGWGAQLLAGAGEHRRRVRKLTCGLRVSTLRSANSHFGWTSYVAFEPVFPQCDLAFYYCGSVNFVAGCMQPS